MTESHPPIHVNAKKKKKSPLSLRLWSAILARCDLIWVDHNRWNTRLIYLVITLYPQKGASPVSQRQWLSNLVGLWVRWRTPPKIQLTSRSRDYVFFEKRHVSTDAKATELSWRYQTQKISRIKSLFCYSKNISIGFISIYTTLKIFKLCR